MFSGRDTGRTAIFFGAQTPSCIEDDIGLVEVMHTLGLRFMQLTCNNQSLLASGCHEDDDTGLTRMGREVVTGMNRVGLVVDMSHSGERSTRSRIPPARSPSPMRTPHPGTLPCATSRTACCARWPNAAGCWGSRSIRTT